MTCKAIPENSVKKKNKPTLLTLKIKAKNIVQIKKLSKSIIIKII